MCQSAKFLCGGLFGHFPDKHLSPPGSDNDEEESGNDADSEAEKYMPKDHKKAIKSGVGSILTSKLGLVRKLTVRDGKILQMGWGQYLDKISIAVKSGNMAMMQNFETIVARRETITEQMLGNLSADNRSETLHTLELTDCKLKKSFPNISSLHNLRVCKLSRNEILVVKKSTFAEGMNLEWLVCDYNKLEALDPGAISFEFLPQLQVLNFAHNKLSFLPTCFATGLQNLRYLDLSYNKLQQLPEAIRDCSNLQLFFLQSNELVRLPDAIESLSKLRKLFVSYNRLTSLPEGIGECKALEKLQASSNKIKLVPDSIIELWKRNGGSLEEFRLDGNPLVQPGLSAFEKGQLDIGFELFDEWLKEEEAERRAEQVAALEIQQQQEPNPTQGQLTSDVLQRVEVTVELVQNALKRTIGTSSTSVGQILTARDGTMHGFDANMSLQKVVADGDDVDDEAEARLEVEGSAAQALDTATTMRLDVDQDFYFKHLRDANGSLDTHRMGQLRSAESSMLLLKKVKFLEGRKALAKQKRDECLLTKKELPKHLVKYLADDLTAVTFTGVIPVTSLDLHFCLLVYVTKPLESTCAALFQRFRGATDYIKRADWDDLCTHVKVKISKDIQQEIWELVAWNKEQISLTDFIAAWHTHDVEVKDPWIRRSARVLKLNYYNMDVAELREWLQARSNAEAEVRAGDGDSSDFSFDSRGEVKNSSSSSSGEESDESREAERRHQPLEVPLVEGERRRALPEKAAGQAGGTPGDGRADPRAKTRQPQQPPGKGGGGTPLSTPRTPRTDGGIPLGKVSLTEDQHFALSRIRDDEESGQESASSRETFPSDELSVASHSSVSSFDARSVLGRMESEDEAEKMENLDAAQRGKRMEISSDLDLLRLMEMSPQEILAAPPQKHKNEDNQRGNADLIKKKVRELRSKSAQKDARFRTDVFTVRLALREARRNLTIESFTTLVNFLLRSLKKMEHSAKSSATYWHADSPNFRHATGVDLINPYVKQLLEQMGFVCLQERYWVWPEKHLSLSDTGSWGRREVKSGCPGRDAMRIFDMVELFTRYQKNLWRERQG